MKSQAIGFYPFPSLRQTALALPATGRRAADRKSLVDRYYEWHNRLKARRELMRLSDYQLRDIGLSRTEAEEEWQKPFWQA